MLNIIFALLLTLVIETFIYVFVKPYDIKLFITVTVMNLVLNPLMNLTLLNMASLQQYTVWLTIFECLTVVIEATVLYFIVKIRLPKAFIFAFIANIVSYGIGSRIDLVGRTNLVGFIIPLILFYFMASIFYLIMCVEKEIKRLEAAKK